MQPNKINLPENVFFTLISNEIQDDCTSEESFPLILIDNQLQNLFQLILQNGTNQLISETIKSIQLLEYMVGSSGSIDTIELECKASKNLFIPISVSSCLNSFSNTEYGIVHASAPSSAASIT